MKRFFQVIVFSIKWQLFWKNKKVNLTEQEEINCVPAYLAIGGVK